MSARRYLADSGQEDVTERILARLSGRQRDAFAEPQASEWYPEETLQITLRLLREETRRDRDDRFVALVEAITEVGVSRFFRLILGVASADFVVRKIPVMWNHIRRGSGKVVVAGDELGARISYSDFPYFDDANYRLLTVGSIRGILGCVGDAGDVTVVSASDDALVVDVVYRARARSIPPPRGG